MTLVSDILKRKGREVLTIPRSATVLEATKAMNQRRVGSIVVVDEFGSVAGILTERDLLTRVIATERDPRRTQVQEAMTGDVVFCTPATPAADLAQVMREKRIRHVPVRDDRGDLCGLVSIGDLNALRAEELSATVESLELYIARG